MRNVEAHDLELYAINTGPFYTRHKALVTKPFDAWLDHVALIVLPRYSREIKPVTATDQTILAVASALQAYYLEHSKEI
jgi:hypothetical protein